MYGILGALKKLCLIWKYFNFASYTYIKFNVPKFMHKNSQYLYIKITDISKSM